MYGEFNGDVFNFRSLPEVLPVFQKHLKNVTSTNICLLVPYNCQPRCFSYQFTYGEFFGHMFNFRSWPEVLPVFLRTLKLVTSTCFPSNPSTLNSMKIFSTSGYGFRSLPVCRKHYQNVTSTLFLNKTSTLNTMMIFSASGYDGKYFWCLKNLQKLYLICLIISYIMKGKSRTNFSLCRISS